MLLTEEELKKWTGYSRRSALIRWLEKEAIDYRLGNKGQIITTLNAIEQQEKATSEEEQRPRFI